MKDSDHSRQSMLSVPARWSDLYFNFFAFWCVVGEGFVIYYGIIERPPSASALGAAADIMLRLAAVPIFAALQAYLIMRARDMAMKTWETFSRERLEKGIEIGVERGREEGMEEGIEIGTQRAIREIRERLAQREASERGASDDWLDEILSDLSENGNGKSRRPRD